PTHKTVKNHKYEAHLQTSTTTKRTAAIILLQSAVDGFDPEKFRRVNKKEPSIDDNKSSSAGSSRGDDVVLLHPHSVPDYDVSEQQILDSIEREFVS
ncbi:hypothetical protein C0J52_13773, partial [Blattella germanica]